MNKTNTLYTNGFKRVYKNIPCAKRQDTWQPLWELTRSERGQILADERKQEKEMQQWIEEMGGTYV
jgi:hypothetical protein